MHSKPYDQDAAKRVIIAKHPSRDDNLDDGWLDCFSP